MKFFHVARNLAFFTVVSLLSIPVQADPTVSAIEFHQLDWALPDGTLLVEDSNWGRMDMTVVGRDPTDIFYLNVVASTSAVSTAWIIQNMPLFPGSLGAPALQTVDFNIEDLEDGSDLGGRLIGDTGGTAGDALSKGFELSLTDAFFDISLTPLSLQPVFGTTVFDLTVNDLVRDAIEFKDGTEFELIDGVGEPIAHKARGEATMLIQHKDVPAVQEGDCQCLAGSFARSISWLDKEHDLMAGTAKKIFDDLIALKVSSKGDGATSYEEDIEAKAKYLRDVAAKKKKKGITKVLDLDRGFKEKDIPTAKFVDAKTDAIKFLFDELKTEDIELDYGHHIITVTGIYKQKDDKGVEQVYLKFRDDEEQGDDAKGDKHEKRGRITKMDSMFFFRRDPDKALKEMGEPSKDFKIRAIISESIPEPGTLGIMILGTGAILLRARKKR